MTEKDATAEAGTGLEPSGERSKPVMDATDLEEVKNLQRWHSDHIDYFREEFQKLSDDEKKCIGNTSNFLAPCQVEVFWIKEPSYQLIVKSNNPRRQDREIIVHGPCSTHVFTEKALHVLNEARFQNKINRDDAVPSFFSSSETYAEEMAQVLYAFTQSVQQQLFHPQIPEGPLSGRAIYNAWAQEFKGNIASTDSKKDVGRIISELKREAKRRKEAVASPPSIATPSEERYDGFGVHFFPPVLIGEKPKPTVEQHLHGRRVDLYHLDKVVDTDLGDKTVIIYGDGYLFFQSAQKLDALRTLNLIMALGYFHGLPLYVAKEHELSQAAFDEETRTIGSMTWNTEPIRSYLFDERLEKPRVIIRPKRKVKKEKLLEILDDARLIMNDERLSEELRLFNEANTHLENYEHAQSFIMSWSVIERHYSDMWRTKLAQKDLNKKRRGKLNNFAHRSIDTVFEVLSLDDKIDDSDYDLLMELKEKRNRFYHEGEHVARADADLCLSLAKRIVSSKISEIKPPSSH